MKVLAATLISVSLFGRAASQAQTGPSQAGASPNARANCATPPLCRRALRGTPPPAHDTGDFGSRFVLAVQEGTAEKNGAV